jgi:hypothetical protein
LILRIAGAGVAALPASAHDGGRIDPDQRRAPALALEFPRSKPSAGRDMEHYAEVGRGAIWRPRPSGWRNPVAILLMLGVMILLGIGNNEMT